MERMILKHFPIKFSIMVWASCPITFFEGIYYHKKNTHKFLLRIGKTATVPLLGTHESGGSISLTLKAPPVSYRFGKATEVPEEV